MAHPAGRGAWALSGAAVEYAPSACTAGNRPTILPVPAWRGETLGKPAPAPVLARWQCLPAAQKRPAANPGAIARPCPRQTPAQRAPRWYRAPRAKGRSCFGCWLFGGGLFACRPFGLRNSSAVRCSRLGSKNGGCDGGPRPYHGICNVCIAQIKLSQFGPNRVTALDAHGGKDDLPGAGFHIEILGRAHGLRHALG